MPTSWPARKKRLSVLLKSATSDAEEGLALDRLLHGQWAIGKTSKTSEIELVRFSHNDLILIGTLEFGQFSVVDVVKCKLDAKLYIRKSIEKRFAYRTRDQCNPQIERDILLRAKVQGACWAPHILCAFQTETHVNLIMTYAEGGTLWDVLESSPLDGRITEHDLRWWLPQVISALSWCHDQGFVHRDVKPHNFVLTASSHIQLIDFACAAPLLTPEPDGSRLVPRQFCLVLCGTCDYISPEILQAHEAALVALEMSDDVEKDSIGDTGLSADLKGYGLETDWWSMGVMVYEMVYGVTPFFANDVRTTYTKIMDHKRSLHFEETSSVSATLREFIERCLTAPVQRLGRCSVQDIQAHSFFKDVPWQDLNQRTPPADLHLPLFSYSNEVTQIYSSAHDSARESSASSSSSSKFHMSPFFDIAQSNPLESPNQRGTSREYSPRSIMVDQTSDYFIGFSWGPAADAFLMSPQPPSLATSQRFNSSILATKLGIHETPCFSVAPALAAEPPFATPSRPVLQTPHPGFSTLPRTSTVRRTARRRAVSDREAMRQLVDCVGMSARKKILAAGRTPRTIARTTKEKNIRFLPSRIETGLSSLRYAIALNSDTSSNDQERASPHGWKQDDLIPTEDESGSAPPSPSPSPRPGSAMSMLSRRSATPTMAVWPTAPSGGYGSQSHRRSTSPLGDPHTPSRHSLERQGQDSSRFSQQLSHLASDLQAQHVPKTDDIQIVRHPLPNRKDPTAMSEVPEDAEPSLAVSLTTDGLRDLEYRYESLVAEIMRLDQCIAQRAHS